jgi:hypothetical protein
MHRLHRWSALAWVALTALPTAAADLSSIERSVSKEPRYAGTPQYLLLAFGEEARTRVWVVLDGDRLFVDRNRNGDLTDDGAPLHRPKDSSWFNVGDVPDADGRTVHLSPRLMARNGEAGAREFQLRFPIRDKYEQWVRYSPFGKAAADAPIVHLDGPLQIGFLNNRDDQQPIRSGADVSLIRGETEEQSVWIGTPNFGKDVLPSAVNFRCSSSTHHIDRALKTDRPTLTVEFPSCDPKDDPIVREIRLDGD